jgi:hypothetical protein
MSEHPTDHARLSALCRMDRTLFIRNARPPRDHHRTLGMVLLKVPNFAKLPCFHLFTDRTFSSPLSEEPEGDAILRKKCRRGIHYPGRDNDGI